MSDKDTRIAFGVAKPRSGENISINSAGGRQPTLSAVSVPVVGGSSGPRQPTTSETPAPQLIRFNVLRNAHYHTARRRSLERTNRVFNFAVVGLGTAAVGGLLNMYSINAEFIGGVVALIGASQLVFDFGRQARDHQALQRDYYNLLADIETETNPDEAQIAEWRGRMIRITADEPPVLRALDAKAYNDTIGAMEMPKEERLHIPWWQQPFAGLIAFDGHYYLKVSERKIAKTG